MSEEELGDLMARRRELQEQIIGISGLPEPELQLSIHTAFDDFYINLNTILHPFRESLDAAIGEGKLASTGRKELIVAEIALESNFATLMQGLENFVNNELESRKSLIVRVKKEKGIS